VDEAVPILADSVVRAVREVTISKRCAWSGTLVASIVRDWQAGLVLRQSPGNWPLLDLPGQHDRVVRRLGFGTLNPGQH
jgi:hypothetical protein